MSSNRKADVESAVADVNFDSTNYQIELDTSAGTIRVNLYPDLAPEHCKNIIGLTKIGFYDGVIFHRVIKGFMIQGGCPEGSGMGGPGFTIDAEFNATPHEPGVLSAARATDPNSAGSQFFLCLERVPHLDNQYTVYGKAADEESLAVIKAIGEVDTNSSDRPMEDVTINRASVVESAS